MIMTMVVYNGGLWWQNGVTPLVTAVKANHINIAMILIQSILTKEESSPSYLDDIKIVCSPFCYLITV